MGNETIEEGDVVGGVDVQTTQGHMTPSSLYWDYLTEGEPAELCVDGTYYTLSVTNMTLDGQQFSHALIRPFVNVCDLRVVAEDASFWRVVYDYDEQVWKHHDGTIVSGAINPVGLVRDAISREKYTSGEKKG